MKRKKGKKKKKQTFPVAVRGRDAISRIEEGTKWAGRF
jgi:hypothetical protein